MYIIETGITVENKPNSIDQTQFMKRGDLATSKKRNSLRENMKP